MEKHAVDPIIVLKVNTSCCKDCPKKLQKGLLIINGVNQVSVDPDKKLVSVKGNIDPFMLIEAITKMGKSAQLMFYDKEPKLEGHRGHNNAKRSREKGPYRDDHHKQSARHKHFSCCDDDDEEFIHKDTGEEYMYKDSNCGRMPSRESERMFGNHTDHFKQTQGFCSGYDTRNSNNSRWFREEPPPYEHYRQRMPPPPPSWRPLSYSYGPFRGKRPMFPFENYPHYFR